MEQLKYMYGAGPWLITRLIGSSIRRLHVIYIYVNKSLRARKISSEV